MYTDRLCVWLCLFVPSIASLPLNQCASHSECTNINEFCSRAHCGGAFMCGVCRPSAECYCDGDSIDYKCPSPGYPTFAVRFLQGIFRNQTAMQAPGYECIRRLVVSGNMFTFSQFPVFTAHPASTATLNLADESISECAGHFKSGVFAGMTAISPETTSINATISSEGTLLQFFS